MVKHKSDRGIFGTKWVEQDSPKTKEIRRVYNNVLKATVPADQVIQERLETLRKEINRV